MMNIVQQQWISPGTALDPDQRVNYEFGLVLGVNEFRQEQAYFLEKNYLCNRELHGCGTVSGLKVTLQAPGDDANDRVVTVEPGIAVDQWGRSIVVRNILCAHLQAWLAKQDQDNQNSVATHLDAAGNGHVYVVANYQAEPEAFVPVPVQGCNSEITQAASRIHDSYNIALTWTKPALPAWDAERNFARLLSQICIVPETSTSDEQKIIDCIRQLDQPHPETPPGIVSPQILQLPASQAREALARILGIWVTEMRPKLLSLDARDTVDNPAILLASIDLKLQKGVATNGSWQILLAQPNDEQRPLLLNAQLAQATILQKMQQVSANNINQSALPFVTVTALSVSPPRFELWFHLSLDQSGNKVFMEDVSSCIVTIELGGSTDSTQQVECAIEGGAQRNVFVLTLRVTEAVPLTPPVYLRLVFPVDQLKLQIASNNVISLREYIRQQNINFEGYDDNDAIITYVRAPSTCVSVI
jgi:hypothetical protein